MPTASAQRARRKKPHRLHQCANVDALVAELRQHDIDLVSLISEFIKPSADVGILVTGTIPWRVATQVSDLDVLILLPSHDAFKAARRREIAGAPVKYWPGQSPNKLGVSLFLSGIELDLDFVINPAIGREIEGVKTAPANQDELASNNLLMTSLATGWIVHGGSVVERWRSHYGSAQLRFKWMAAEFAAGTKNLEDLAAGIGLAVGHVSAIGADIVSHLLRALLAYQGSYCPSLKYLLGIDRLLGTVDEEMRDLLIAGRALACPGLLIGVEAERAYFDAVLDFSARVQKMLSRDEAMAELIASLIHDLDIILPPCEAQPAIGPAGMTVHTAWNSYIIHGPDGVVGDLEAIAEPYLLVRPEAAAAATWTILLDAKESDRRAGSEPHVDVDLDPLGKTLLLRGPRRWLAVQCLRHIRAIDRTDAVRRKALSLHGACVALGNRAIAIVGPSKSGKTTAALSVARSIDAVMIANDDVILTADGGWAAQGLPRSTGIRVDNLQDYWPVVTRAALLEADNLHPQTPEEKVFLAPRELGRIGVRCTAARVPLVGVIALEVGSAQTGLSRIHAADAEALVAPWIDETPDRFRPQFAAALGLATVPDRLAGISRLCRDLPIHRCVHPPAGWAQDFVRACQELLA